MVAGQLADMPTCRMVNSPKVKPSHRWVESHTCDQIRWRPPAMPFQLRQQHVFAWRTRPGNPRKFASIFSVWVDLSGSWPWTNEI